MSKGRRYNNEPKLNIKKVFAVIIFILVIVMIIFAMKTLMTKEETVTGKVSALNYFPVYTEGKWGVIDSLGKITIDATYDEMVVVPNKAEDVFICTYNVDYETGKYKTKVLNSKNKEIFNEFDMVEPILNTDKNKNVWYESSVLKVQKNGKYGLIDYTGKEVLKCSYDNIYALEGIENSLIIEENGKLGLTNTQGSIIINTEYKEINPLTDDYKNGYIVVNSEGKYGVIDVNKTVILEPQFDEILKVYSEGKYGVKQNGDYLVIDKTGKELLTEGFDEIEEINGENIVIKLKNKYGIINLDGEELISNNYDSLKYAFDNYYIAKKGNLYGIVSLDNEEILPFEYTSIIYRKQAGFIEAEKEDEIETEIYNSNIELKLTGIISECNEAKGYIRLRTNGEYKYYNFKFEEKNAQDLLTTNVIFLSKKNGKYGYIDKDGNVVINYIYDDATEQNNYGFASVKKDGKWGSIDASGNVKQEPKFALENNSKIDFIGKWHISEDTNYYTDL